MNLRDGALRCKQRVFLQIDAQHGMCIAAQRIFIDAQRRQNMRASVAQPSTREPRVNTKYPCAPT